MSGAADPPSRHGAAVVGMSVAEVCGVRDHAAHLADALAAAGLPCSMHWLDRHERTLRGSRAEVGEWAAGLRRELECQTPDAILLHYSVFSFAWRGIPLFGPVTLAALRRCGAPILTVLHEGAYNWGGRGLREAAWSLTQRAELIELVHSSAALIVTADNRARWLAGRRWIARRPTFVAPVFSNLPASPDGIEPSVSSIGLFGYAHEGSDPALLLDALAIVRERGIPASLVLLGAPGPDSDGGERWRAAADARGLGAALSFSGTLPPAELSRVQASCEVLLFADTPGPSSRKTTLAAGLASGRPMLALDGPRSWPALVEAQAALIVQPAPDQIADGLVRLLSSEHERAELATRGKRFYASAMSVEHGARVVLGALDQVLEPTAGRAPASHSVRAAP